MSDLQPDPNKIHVATFEGIRVYLTHVGRDWQGRANCDVEPMPGQATGLHKAYGVHAESLTECEEYENWEAACADVDRLANEDGLLPEMQGAINREEETRAILAKTIEGLEK